MRYLDIERGANSLNPIDRANGVAFCGRTDSPGVASSFGSAIIAVMSDVTEILSKIDAGDQHAAEQLLPLIYDDLRCLASARLAREKPGQTLQPTALVHEAFLRLVDVKERHHWETKGHFFAAAAESMRRILVENARRKGRHKHGGQLKRVELQDHEIATSVSDDRLLAVDEALDRLETEEPELAKLVKLRFFAGFSLTEAAKVLGFSRSKAYEQWAYARAWLQCAIGEDGE